MFERTVLQGRWDLDGLVETAVGVVHEVAFGAHLHTPATAIVDAHPQAEPGGEVGADEADDPRTGTIDVGLTEDPDCRRARPETAEVFLWPAEGRRGPADLPGADGPDRLKDRPAMNTTSAPVERWKRMASGAEKT